MGMIMGVIMDHMQISSITTLVALVHHVHFVSIPRRYFAQLSGCLPLMSVK